MDARSFVRFVRIRTTRLASFLEKEALIFNANQRSRFFDAKIRDDVAKSLDALLNLREKDVERVIWDQHKLRDERLVTCLVPYQLGANIILNGLPKDVRRRCVDELKAEEISIAEGVTRTEQNKFLQWEERDVFVSTGINYLRHLHPRQDIRTSIIAVMGHSQHGKTTLLDVLQKTNFSGEESRKTTQSIRAFTTLASGEGFGPVTFVDTPGQRIFTETRFHAQIIADCLLLVVSVVEGVQSQTYETIKVALNLDKPLVVVLNKLDLYSDSQKLREAVSKVLVDLREAGLNVTMIRKEKDIDRLRVGRPGFESDTKVSTEFKTFRLFAPMKKVDPNYRGSGKLPLVDLHRDCAGVCISAKEGKNLGLLWSLIELMTSVLAPLCYSKAEDYTSHCCSLQAVILESSKHLFDEEGFRVRKSLQHIQKKQDLAFEKKQLQLEKNSILVRIHSSLNTIRKKSQSGNPTSTNSLVLTVIVKEGCITKGVLFVADQTKGRVDYIVDARGNFLDRAYPGMAVTIIDVHSNTGCPGVGTHLLSMPSVAERDRIFEYRRLLQWFVECFSDRLHLLRPRGMDVSFVHLGDYGQLKSVLCLEYQLLYGPPQTASLVGPDVSSFHKQVPTNDPKLLEKSIAEYLHEKNAEDQEYQKRFLLEEGSNRKVIMDDDLKFAMQNTWTQLQPRNRPESQEAYVEMMKNCIQIGILFKVDSWHSARMLYREVNRLGTRKVAFHVIGMRFGEFIVDDVLFFGQAMKIAVCYRTPLGLSTDLDRYLEINNIWVLQTDDISEVVDFLKWCAVALHKEYAPDDYGITEQGNRNYWVLRQGESIKKSEERREEPGNGRRRTLLIAPKFSHQNL